MGSARLGKTSVECGFAETSYGRIHYRAGGSGRPILLLHINRQSSATYVELIEELAADFHAVAIDYPGYGLSDHLPQPPTIADYAQCAREVLASLGCEEALVLGEAVGAAVAVAFARAFPDRTRGVVLINGPLMPNRKKAEAFIGGVRESAAVGRAALEAEFADAAAYLARNAAHAPLAPTRSWLDRVKEARLQCREDCWQAADALLAFDFGAELAGVRCPVLSITGAESPFHDQVAAIAAALPGSVTEILPDARFAIHWERAEAVARRTANFAAMT